MGSYIVGYGSLVSHNSLKETIKDKHFIPVIVKGYKRIFDIAQIEGENSDVLNLKKSPKNEFNGVMFSVTDKELEKLKQREDGYELEQVPAYHFKTKDKLGNCFVFLDKTDLDKSLFPYRSYFLLCRDAAYHISKKFGKMWDETTFVSTGEKISEWLKEHKEYDDIDNDGI
jgi:hypothetical protein